METGCAVSTISCHHAGRIAEPHGGVARRAGVDNGARVGRAGGVAERGGVVATARVGGRLHPAAPGHHDRSEDQEFRIATPYLASERLTSRVTSAPARVTCDNRPGFAPSETTW